ncbi:MAG: SdpA family antimicrobial peptide system protein [Mycobacterium sp.]
MKRTVIVGIAYACVLIAAAVLSVGATLPSNIVWERTQLRAVRAQLNTIAGQDFAFFTRSPETEQVTAYRLQPDGNVAASLLVTPQAKASNLFGLSRTQRAQGPELANLLRAVPPDGWADCTGLDRTTCVEEVLRKPKAFLHNNSPIPTVCGPVALTVESTTKWAYRRLAETRYNIERIALASIDCIHGH